MDRGLRELPQRCELVGSSTVLTIAIHISRLVYIVILHEPLWLQVCSTELAAKGLPYIIIHRLVATHIKSCMCTAFVSIALCAVTPLSQSISTILTYRSSVLFLITLGLPNAGRSSDVLTAPSGHILTKDELDVLATLLGDEKLNAIKTFVEERQGRDITREEVERLLMGHGFTSLANSLEDNLKKGI